MKSRRLKVPASVLERAKAAAANVAAGGDSPKKMVVAELAAKPRRASVTKSKVVAALKKLHPMD
ncbi:MAG: hypothetical protein JNM17_40425 [Archangium sp.]|nr:hypothetical protein [Archangium sp.]